VSGLDGWAVRMDRNNGWEHGFGVSCGVDPAAALRLSRAKSPPVIAVKRLTEQDRRFVLLSTSNSLVYCRGVESGVNEPGATPTGAVLHAPTGLSVGTVVTFQVDRKATALLVQTHRPVLNNQMFWSRPQPSTAPSAKDAEGRVPSQVQRIPLPAGMRWEDVRPTLTLWYVLCCAAIPAIRSHSEVWSVCCAVCAIAGATRWVLSPSQRSSHQPPFH
jgi:hypothetical protein